MIRRGGGRATMGAVVAAVVLSVVACGKVDGRGSSGGNVEEDSPGQGGSAGANPHAAPASEAGDGGGMNVAAGAGAGAGAGGAGAGGADAGAGGDGGQGGDGGYYGVGTDCNGDPFELNPGHTKFCVLLASCAGPNYGPFPDNREGGLTTSICVGYGPVQTAFGFYTDVPVEWPLQFDARVSACSSSIDSCADVLACAGYRNPVDECKQDLNARCDGELAINCGEHGVVIDCARTTGVSGTCKVATSAGTKRAVCDTGQQCADASSPPACDGDTLYSCEAGISNGTDCRAFGLVCQEYRGYAACVPSRPTTTCTDLDTPGCSGSKRTYCSSDGVLFEHECDGVAPLTCMEDYGEQSSDRMFLHCGPKGCKPFEELREEDACEKDDLRLGMLGGTVLHCPDYGFATCRDGVCAD